MESRPSIPSAGDKSLSLNAPAWCITFVCGHCVEPPWFECAFRGCEIPVHKNLFRSKKQLQSHARHWHKRTSESSNLNDSLTYHTVEEVNGTQESAELDGTQEVDDNPRIDASGTFCFSNKETAQFAEWCITASVNQAIQCLVQQSLFQAPVSLYQDNRSRLAPHVVQLYLHISIMLLTTGQTHHVALANILELLFGLIPIDNQEWPAMPKSLSGFQSHVLNPTNQYSLVSMLPVPTCSMLDDQSHSYCCLREIIAFVLLLPKTKGAPQVPLRLQQLCKSKMMKDFLSQAPPIRLTECLISIGLLFWLDGWDPSASSKNNRSPIHTATVTLLCIDNLTGVPFNARTFPIACGPGKANHDTIFQALRISLRKVMAGDDIVWSAYHGRWTTIRAKVIAFLMDQPERRGTNCLLGGNSKQHALFGVSCMFENLERSFSACPKCLRAANRYLELKDFGSQLVLSCRLCYGFSLSRLLQHGRYTAPCHSKLSVDTPGYSLTDKPGSLTFEILVDAWQYALRRFVHDTTWSKEDVRAYFTLLCINKGTIDDFICRCSNYVLLQHINKFPQEYDDDVMDFVSKDCVCHPQLYALPDPPSSWRIGTIHQKVETIMHLAMNTQKAVLILVLHWASSLDKGTELKKRLQPMIESVHNLRLPFAPCRTFKNEKFGGWVAENYRAFTMIAPWLFSCLSDDEFAPRVIVLPPSGKLRSKWTIKENKAWLRVRGIKVSPKTTAEKLKKIVDDHHTNPLGPPKVISDTTPTAKEMRHLIVLLFRVFGTLFSRDTKELEAANRFEALVIQFLDCVERVSKACHPDQKQPIWLSKYGMLGLLRCRQHFLDYSYPHSLYEGGIEGKRHG